MAIKQATKKLFLLSGKILTLLGAILQELPYRWAFILKNKLDNKIIYWHHKNLLNIYDL
jgi:hypothetical protein